MLELAKNDRQDGYKCLEAVCECVFLLSTPRFQRLLNVRVRSRRRTLDMDEEGKESDKCSICLRPFDKQAVASLESCQHAFCLECILQWSQTANTCPVDRSSFAVIHQRRCPGGDIQKKIKVSVVQREEDEDEEEASSPLTCEECGRCDRGHQLLMHHMDCLASPLNTDTEDGWVCPECAVIPQDTENSMVVEGEISDGELTDLVAEGGDDAALVSSRLRPSTLSRPHGFTERRHSQRIQSRTRTSHRAIPSSQTQTSRHVPKYLLLTSKPAQVSAPHHSNMSSASVDTRTSNKRKRAT
ncbi:PHD and RING finger domain-containing protein 1-like isoform X2 [Nelusetta ayraudi]|uniref:PHD and RING finger domain-containing protein 1-like isoform X2 n=1 Tax=Nelusetta ayraudi TaxID=303726 RepID=UPI003F725877